jgi:heavy metal sensor kinase
MLHTRQLPVRIRLALWYVATFSLVLLLFGAGTFYAVRASIEADFDRELKLRVAGIESFLGEASGHTLPEIQHELSEDSELRPGGEMLQVSDGEGRWIYQSDSIRRLHVRMPRMEGRGPQLFTVHVHHVPLRLLSTSDLIRGTRYNIQVAQSLEESERFNQRLGWMLITASPLLLLAVSAIGYWMAKRALQPVVDITADARAITALDIANRIKLPPARDELRALSQTLNEMLERLEVAFRRVTQFTADASHELRTPIALIRTTAELALEENVPKASREALKSILQESERTTTMLQDLLALARADSNVRLRMEQVNCIMPLREAVSQASVLASSKAIELCFATDLDIAELSGNRDWLRRLFLIFIDNGIKYTLPGGTVHVKATNDSGTMNVEIRDNGIGISPKDLPHIFERFYRADKARDRSAGAGLGLSIADWIGKAHRATIDISSVLGEGTLVTLRFPATRVVEVRQLTSEPHPQPM